MYCCIFSLCFIFDFGFHHQEKNTRKENPANTPKNLMCCNGDPNIYKLSRQQPTHKKNKKSKQEDHKTVSWWF